MCPFELPDDDPLLGGDSSPSSGDGGDDDAPTEASDTSVESLLASGEGVDSDTIFEDGEAQIVVRSEEDISSGELAGLNASLRHFSRRGLFHLLDKLGELNALLQDGWVLDRVEFRRPPAASLAFVLNRENDGE